MSQQQGDSPSIRELGGEIWAELKSEFPDERLNWKVSNEVVDLIMGVLARHVGSSLVNDDDFPVIARPKAKPNR
jgi:hypothetical protein